MEMPDDRAKNPYVFESEVLSPYARLQSGESYSWRYGWYACRIGGDFPVENAMYTVWITDGQGKEHRRYETCWLTVAPKPPKSMGLILSMWLPKL